MSESTPSRQAPDDDLQFTQAEPAIAPATATPGHPGIAGGGIACAVCKQPIADSYYTAGKMVVCPGCRQKVLASLTGGSAVLRLVRATVFGVVACVVGAAVWAGIRYATNMELGIVAVAVGFGVGKAVRAGAQGRGGIGYQLLAVALSYFAISASLIPQVILIMRKDHPDSSPIGQIVVGVITFAIGPVLVGISDIIMALIFSFALWEAWKINKRPVIALLGPYSLGAQPTAATPIPTGPPAS